MTDATICPCDDALPTPPSNLPGLDHIDFRIGDFVSFRRALLTPMDGEQALTAWRPGSDGDLAVMMLEWWAYLADALAFYNERFANQGFLRTADLPESPGLLIALLGYRPRPAIGARGTLAALATAGQSAVLPKGLQIQSKPGPGQAPQIFELSADTAIGSPDMVPATAPGALLAPTPGVLLLQGVVRTVAGGALLLLRGRDGGSPVLATVASADIQQLAGGVQQTRLSVTLGGSPPPGLAAAQARLDRANQATALWSLFLGASVRADKMVVHLAGLVRQIRAGDMVLFTAPGFTPALRQASAAQDVVWDATGSAATPATPADATHPVPTPHTALALTEPLDDQDWNGWAASVTVSFDWIEAGRLSDQPPAPFTGEPQTLLAMQPAAFPPAQDRPVLVQDAAGLGVAARSTSSGGGAMSLGGLTQPAPALQSPLNVLFNLLPVTRGQTVAGEILGSGDATVAGQSFTLAKSPVTYLASGPGYVSTVAVTVGGQPWTEVASFYGQPPDARIFVTREDTAGKTHVDFGDGVNGARLPTGRSVTASYRIGAGAASPGAGKLTVMGSSYPGLKSVLNPVAVVGGADPDPPDQIRRYAPRSVLTFGRAVSILDYEAIAAQAPGVTRAKAAWGWDPQRQRALVRVFVGDDAAACASATTALAGAWDPNRAGKVVPATPVEMILLLAVMVTPGWDAAAIVAEVRAALADPQIGLFAPSRLAIGQAVFDSQIEAACLSVVGTVAVIASLFWTQSGAQPGPVRSPGEGGYFDLPPERVFVITEPDPNG